MEIIEYCSKYVIAGNTRITVECTQNGGPGSVSVECTTNNLYKLTGDAVYDGSAEMLERIAEVCRRLRATVGDRRVVCPDHGYYDADAVTCPSCSYGDSPVVDSEMDIATKSEKTDCRVLDADVHAWLK